MTQCSTKYARCLSRGKVAATIRKTGSNKMFSIWSLSLVVIEDASFSIHTLCFTCHVLYPKHMNQTRLIYNRYSICTYVKKKAMAATISAILALACGEKNILSLHIVHWPQCKMSMVPLWIQIYRMVNISSRNVDNVRWVYSAVIIIYSSSTISQINSNKTNNEVAFLRVGYAYRFLWISATAIKQKLFHWFVETRLPIRCAILLPFVLLPVSVTVLVARK